MSQDWVDYNGHMNVEYFVLLFDSATDVLLDRLEIDASCTETGKGTRLVLELTQSIG